MHRTFVILSALFIPACLAGCNTINLTMDSHDEGSGCCGCGCQVETPDNDGAGGADVPGGSGPGDSKTSSSSSGAGGNGGGENGQGGAGAAGGGPAACECPPGYQMTPAGDACFTESTSEPVMSATIYNVCHIDENGAYGIYGAIVEGGGTAPGGTTELNAYWQGRLNTAGVWACGAGSDATGTLPTDEWIGFSVCVDILQSGDYILGIAGDNRVRIDIDGINVVMLDSSDVENFRYWHLLPVHLTSGVHTIELQGKNDGLIAGFGAEVSGPFAAGSIDTDSEVLDEGAYDANLIWSTRDLQPGQTFQLGETSGWQCPDQAALDVCADKPACTTITYLACSSAP